MSDPMEQGGSRPAAGGLGSQIRASALGLLISGGLCVYFGFSLTPDAPPGLSPEVAEQWYAHDEAFNMGLRIVGAAFLVAAALAAAGQRLTLVLAAVVEVALGVLLVVMSVERIVQARVAGMGFDFMLILLLIVAIVSVTSAHRYWKMFRASQPAPPAAP